MKNVFLLVFFIILSFYLAEAQKDTSKIDSLQLQEEALNLMKKADSSRVSDSVTMDVLKKQLSELTKYETSKRRELEKQLNKLNQKDSLNRIAIKKEIDSLKSIAKGFPIFPYKDTLFKVYTKIGQLTARERAEIINSRLTELYSTFILKFDTLHVIDYGKSVDIMFKDKTILSITEYDEMWFEQPKVEIANNYKSIIYKDLKFYKENTSFFTILRQIGLATLVIILQILFIKVINFLFKRKAEKFIISQKGTRIKGIKIKEYQFLDEDKETNVILFISKLFRWFINLVQLYITIPVLFSIFPPTRRLAETLFGYILDPAKRIGMSFVNFLPNLFAIIVIIIITRYIVKFFKYLADEISTGNLKIQGFYPDWAKPTFNILRVFIMAFMFVVIFPYLPGSNSPVFQGVSVFLGIMFSLGSSSVIGNMVAGLVMTYMRPFKIGDRIKVGDISGDVLEKTPFVTRIKTIKNEFITIPNSNILSSNVVNYNTSIENEGIILHTTVTIGYDVPWKHVHEILLNAAKKTTYILDSPKSFVLQTSLDDFYVSYQLNVYSNYPNKQASIYSELHQNIQDCFNEGGVEILSPHYRAQRDGNMTTIPANYLQRDYIPPSFRVENTTKEKD